MIRSSLFTALVAIAALSASTIACSAAAEPGFTLEARITLDAFRATVDARLAGTATATRLLAAAEEARSGDWARIRGPLGTLVTSLPEAAAVWYAKSDGSLFTVEKGATGDSLRDRAGELIFAFPSDVGGATLGDAVKTMLSQPEGVVHYDHAGSDKTAVFARSTLTGWTYVLGKAHPVR